MFVNPMKLLPAAVSQVITVISCSLLSLSGGMNFAWTSPIAPILLSPNSTIKAGPSDLLLLETLYMLGGLFEVPITFYLMDKIGRKNTILLGTVEGLIAWIMIAGTASMAVLFVARFMAGIVSNIIFMVVPVYVAEISDKKIRGHLLSIIYIMMMMGTLLMYTVGPYISIPQSAIIGACILIMQLLSFPFMPRSPYFLLMKHQQEEAQKSLIVLRSLQDVEKELEEIACTVEKEMSEHKGLLDLFRIKSNLKAAMILTVLYSAQNFSGFTALFMNIHLILNEADASISSNMGAILFSMMMLVGSLITGILTDFTGRKCLLCTSTVLTATSLFILASYFTLKDKDVNVDRFSWLPIFALLFYAFTFQSGLGTITNLLVAELYPTNIKAIGITYCETIYGISSLLSVVIFNILQRFGMEVSFYLFGFYTASACLFSIFFVPETKGKSFSEIQCLLKGRGSPNSGTTEENSETEAMNKTLCREDNDYGTSSN